jgi:chromosome segregation ATPase
MEMTAAEAAEWGKTLSFETVWAALTKSSERIDKMGEKVDKTAESVKQMAERADQMSARADRMSARVDQTSARVDRLSANVGGLNRSLGELIETLIAARLWEKFPQYGLSRAYQRIPIYDEKKEAKTDIDILLINNDSCMAVEVKRELDRRDEVERHIKRMELIRKWPPELVGTKQLFGAMAGGVVDPDIKDYAYSSGFYVLELTGESVHLIPPPEGFEPQKW